MYSCNSKRTRMLPESFFFFMFADSIVLHLSTFRKTTRHTWPHSLTSYSNACLSCYPFKRRIPQCPFLPPSHLYPQSAGRSFVLSPQRPKRPQQQRRGLEQRRAASAAVSLPSLRASGREPSSQRASVFPRTPPHLARTWSRPGSCRELGEFVPGALGNRRAPWGRRPGPGSPAAVAAAFPDFWRGASCWL